MRIRNQKFSHKVDPDSHHWFLTISQFTTFIPLWLPVSGIAATGVFGVGGKWPYPLSGKLYFSVAIHVINYIISIPLLYNCDMYSMLYMKHYPFVYFLFSLLVDKKFAQIGVISEQLYRVPDSSFFRRKLSHNLCSLRKQLGGENDSEGFKQFIVI